MWIRIGRTFFPILSLAVSCTLPQDPERTQWSQWQQVPNVYADRFEVWKKDAQRLVLVFGHGGRQDTVGRYWLNLDGAVEYPPVEAISFSSTLDRVALSSTTHVPFVTAIGRTNAVLACAHLDQVRDSVLLRSIRSGSVKEIAMGDGLDRESLLALKPDAVFAYPFGKSEGDQLSKLGIPVIEVSEYLEEHALGRAEWLRFFGVILGEERKADSLFAGIRMRYEAIRVDSSASDRPTVLFGSVWNGQWWVPPGNSYMARLIEDAGGRYVFADRKGDGNIAIDMETMVTVGAKADYWGMIANRQDSVVLSDFTGNDDRLGPFASIPRGLFIGNSAKADLFGQALIEPDRELMDLIIALHPNGCYYIDRLPVRPAGYFKHVEWPAIPGMFK